MTTNRTAYLQGFDSGANKYSSQKNPFNEKSPEHTRWQEGFADGLKERTERNDELDYWGMGHF